MAAITLSALAGLVCQKDVENGSASIYHRTRRILSETHDRIDVPMVARIRVIRGPRYGETFEVAAGKLIIGREEDCHLRPDSEFISRHHCALLLDDYTLRVRDLGSKNGTWLNGERIGRGDIILSHGDEVSIGEMTFVIDLDQEPPLDGLPAPSAPSALEGTGVVDGPTAPSRTHPFGSFRTQSVRMK